MAEFRRAHEVRFADADYAGLIFYPRYFEALNRTVEDWFAQALGIPFLVLMDKYRVGSPLVSVTTDFIAACRLGDRLETVLRVEKLGTASLQLHVETLGEDGTVRMRSRMTLVCATRDLGGSTPWPAPVRAAILALDGKE